VLEGKMKCIVNQIGFPTLALPRSGQGSKNHYSLSQLVYQRS